MALRKEPSISATQAKKKRGASRAVKHTIECLS